MQKHFGDRHDHGRQFTYTEMDGDWENQESRSGRSRTSRVRHKPLEKYSRSKQQDWFDVADDDFSE